MHNVNFFQRFLKKVLKKVEWNGNIFPRFLKKFSFLKIQRKFLPKALKKFKKMMHKQGPTGRANLFTSVFGKQYELILIITSRTKPEILGHVVHLFLCVHQVHRLLYEQDETVCCLSTEKRF